ncbi:hypothetical protein EB118_02790 [bacterium]|nr:hypothetical protein [Actinomycetota bacterium]NDG29010.1 hypothetical protein [bacterium]
MPTIRKLRKAPPLPTNPNASLNELKTFRCLLADRFYDYDFHHVYESVFFDRVELIMKTVDFDCGKIKDEHFLKEIRDLGNYIVDTRSTEVRLFIIFFDMILKFLG